jgi:hypothetical protein
VTRREGKKTAKKQARVGSPEFSYARKLFFLAEKNPLIEIVH